MDPRDPPGTPQRQSVQSPGRLARRLKISLDELRMQTMGAQTLFGFQLQSLFQPGFDRASPGARIADGLSLAALVVSFTALVVAPVEHHLVEAGQASRRLIRLGNRCAETALAAMAAAFGTIAFTIAAQARLPHPLTIAALAGGVAFAGWFSPGFFPGHRPPPHLPEREMTDLHTRIDQMLTEARVILPGVQAMLGFQLIVVMTAAFGNLPDRLRALHLAGLALTGLAVVLLIAPAAVHRLAFRGDDDPRFHRIGTMLVNSALLPLALAISADVLVAFWKLSGAAATARAAAGVALLLMLGSWYALPLLTRARLRRQRRARVQ